MEERRTLRPRIDHLGHVQLFAAGQDLIPDLDLVRLDSSSNVGAIVGRTGDQGDLGLRIHGEGEDEGAVFLLSDVSEGVRRC